MPKLDGDMENFKLGGNFNFTGAPMEKLGASEYTLVTIAVDKSGSLGGHEDQVREMLMTAVKSCKKSDRVENLLLRVIMFDNHINELHGFVPLNDIDPDADYSPFRAGGGTALYDACYSGVESMNAYADKLEGEGFTDLNAIAFIITDGCEMHSTSTAQMVKDALAKGVSGEKLESMISVLIGINASRHISELTSFQQDAGITQFIDAGDATKGKLAKLADFVSQSISSQSQSLGTGGPSQNISATI